MSRAMDAPDALFALADESPPVPPAHSSGPAPGFAPVAPGAPLAVRMRPESVDELVGQGKLLAPGAPLRRLVSGGAMTSVILWGPPGTGKTTIAHLVARAAPRGSRWSWRRR